MAVDDEKGIRRGTICLYKRKSVVNQSKTVHEGASFTHAGTPTMVL